MKMYGNFWYRIQWTCEIWNLWIVQSDSSTDGFLLTVQNVQKCLSLFVTSHVNGYYNYNISSTLRIIHAFQYAIYTSFIEVVEVIFT